MNGQAARMWTAMWLTAGLALGGAATARAGDEKPAGGSAPTESKAAPSMAEAQNVEGTVLAFKMKDIDGQEVDLAKYRGNVLLIVNTASRCGYTPQYAKLQELQVKHGERGFFVLGFPANEFGNQEPGDNPEIKKFCTEKYHVTFPMFAKVCVKGEGICELYRFLTSEKTNPKFAGEIPWNFTKFLVDREGRVVGRYRPSDDPVKSAKLTADLEKALAAPKSPAGEPKR